jgi:hypothetical protein
MSLLTRIRKTREPAQPVLLPGDIVRDADGSLALLVRIGWNGKASPYFVEEDDATMTRAFILGLEVDERGSYRLWMDWVLVGELRPADFEGEAVFREAVLASKYAHHFVMQTETTAEAVVA